MKLPPAVRLDVPEFTGTGNHAFQHGPLRVLVTDAEDHGEEGLWRHVSVSHPGRMPSYEELSALRDEYFDPAATVLQVMPPVSAWVNQHERCLHLWQRLDRQILPRGLDRTVGMVGGVPFDDRESALLKRGHFLAALLHNLLRARGTLNVRDAEEVLARYFTARPGELHTEIVTTLEFMARTLPHVRQGLDRHLYRWVEA